ncbi:MULTISPECIES: NAD(P)H-binding protein [unclassified Peribacillus]|uniref:NAD(P)H-binding protein n=1 Tax=unclassified Peribacillus TaxID=2675266 RepID=UPI0036701A93
MKQKAVVVGGTGLIGNKLVKLLLSSTAYDTVTLLVRRPTGLKHPKLDEKIIEFEQLDRFGDELTGADVFCTLGTTIKKAGSQNAFRKVDLDYPITLGKMAKKHKARQFLIVTALGANLSSRSFYTRVKGEVEVALRDLNLPALHIFRPSLLLGERDESRIGERFFILVFNLLSPVFIGPLRKYKAIHAQSVAKAMLLKAQNVSSGIHIYESNQIKQISKQF